MEMAKRAKGFGMNIVYYDVIRNEEREKEYGATYCSDVKELLAQSDFVSIHVNLTPETRHLINAETLSGMKSTAVLVNTSRGPVVDQTALYHALKDGTIGAAGLDVTEVEPISMDDPLLTLENVIIAPHIASGSVVTRTKMSLMAVDNLMAGLNGEPLPNTPQPRSPGRKGVDGLTKGRGRCPRVGSGPGRTAYAAALHSTQLLAGVSGSDPGRDLVNRVFTALPFSGNAIVEATNTDAEDWVQARLDAYFTLFNITPEGRDVIASLDVRQMEGQPAWYGSTGYRGFTGVGQARPDVVAHELGHAYWGAFPVTGHPELSWEAAEGETIPSAMARYHEDLRRFMLQPPDRYEPLRERFRNFPNLNQGRLPDLIHAGEADIPRLTAGDLGLTPPILRKYFDQYMSDGGYGAWADLMGWYAGLDPEDKRLTDGYLQIAHIPTAAYSGVGRGEGSGLDEEVRDILVGEERQRLIDFVEQFDLVLGDDDSLRDAAYVDRGFPFWRSYLREMFAIHKRHPGLVEEYESGGTEDSIAVAFEALESAMGRGHGEAVEYLTKKLEEERFPLQLPSSPRQPTAAGGSGTGGGRRRTTRPCRREPQRLWRSCATMLVTLEMILEAGEGDPGAGARALEEHVRSLGVSDPTKLQQNVDTILELLFSTDSQAAEAITGGSGKHK